MAGGCLLEETLMLAKQIPKGRVSTYGALAGALGSRKLARAVGKSLSKNPTPLEIPCHRIVHSDGRAGGYKLGAENKIRLLRNEGIWIKSGRVENLARYLFKDFKKTRRRKARTTRA